METPREIVAFIGQDTICEALGVSGNAVRQRLMIGTLPASWYDALEQLAGRPLPRSAFTFKGTEK